MDVKFARYRSASVMAGVLYPGGVVVTIDGREFFFRGGYEHDASFAVMFDTPRRTLQELVDEYDASLEMSDDNLA